jgi:Holliday junction resolvasome RuvABC endonuclease subunit
MQKIVRKNPGIVKFDRKVGNDWVSVDVQPLHLPAILTNDPSMTAWGWVVLSFDGKILATGCIKTEPTVKKLRIRKGDSTVGRISEINKILLDTIKKYNVTYVLSELPHGSQNASAAVMIGAVAAIVQTICDTLDIGVEFYSEGDSKKCLLGKLSATKKETIDAVSKLYDIKWTGVKYKDEAIADALSIHYTATKQSSVLKLLKHK